MKYRIKIRTFSNGRQEFVPEVEKLALIGKRWQYIGYNGDEVPIEYDTDTREKALVMIDRHHVGNAKLREIHFEYIEK